MNPAAEGTTYPDVVFTVDPARVATFRELFGTTQGVPPTFVSAAEFTVFPRIIADPNLALNFSRALHGSQDYVYERPLREGETLTVKARIDSIRHKGGNGFVVLVMELVDGDGAPVVTARLTLIERAPEEAAS